MKKISIRFAQVSDSQTILNMVTDLAIFEKAPNEVFTLPKEYEDGLKSGLFRCLLAENSEGTCLGIALFYPVFSTWNGKTLYLEDFIVQEDQRGTGIGKLLFEAYLEVARSEGYKMAKWQVLDWNESAIAFYEKYQAKVFPGWLNGTIKFT